MSHLRDSHMLDGHDFQYVKHRLVQMKTRIGLNFAKMNWGAIKLNTLKHIFLTACCIFALFATYGKTPVYDAMASKYQRDIEDGARLLASNKYAEAEAMFLDAFNNDTDRRNKVKACYKLTETYYITGENNKALYFGLLAINSSTIKDSIELYFRTNTILASIYLRQNDIAMCDTFLRRNIAVFENIADADAIANFYYTIGKYKLCTNEFRTGLKMLKSAAANYEDSIVTLEYGKILLQYCRMHRYRNDFSAACRNADEAAMIFDKLGFALGKVESMCIIGNIHLQSRNYTEALKHFKQAQSISDTLNINRAKMMVSLSLTNWYLSQNDLNSAMSFFQEASDHSRGQADLNAMYTTNIMFCNYYLNHNDIDAAIYYLNKAKENCKNTNSWEKEYTIYKMYGDIYHLRNDINKSEKYYGMALAFGDSLLNSVRTMTTDSLSLDIESNRQNDLIRYLTNEDKMQKTTINDSRQLISKQKSSIMSLLGLFMIFFILMFMLAWSFLIKFRDNKELQETNERIVLQKEEIDAQRQHLFEYNQELERLSIIARETNNAIRIFDNNGNTTWVNPGYTRLHGFTLEDLQANSSLGIGDIDIKSMIQNWNFNNQSIEFESEIKNKWNIKIWIQTTISPVIDEETLNVKSLIAIDTNITSLKLAQQDILSMNKEITDSITYAKRIQEAMMPSFSILQEHYPNSFKLYRPRSIVSGDFYWITEQDGRLIVACADSTGHGVPGAFLSLIGISFLSKIVNERRIVQPSVILNRLRTNIIEHLHQNNNDMAAGDGMDMTIISIDKSSNIMEFSGAMNPIYIIRDGHIIELRPDRMPVGFYDNEYRSFSTSRVQIKQNDQIYMFSDGYYDQFGGDNGLKMKTSRFKQILKTCCMKSNDTQTAILEKEFDLWRGRYEQVDDIIILGIQIN